MIGTANGTWATTPYCNGANATVMASLNCTVPQSVLLVSPFSLTISSSVSVTIYA